MSVLTERIAGATLVAVSYYLAAKVGFAFTFQPHPISVLWPPNALLLSALLLSPTRNWGWLLAAALPAHLAAELQSGVPLAMVLGWFVSNCGEAVIGAWLVRFMARGPVRFDALRPVSAFLVGAVLMAPFVSSFLDAALVKLVGWGEGAYWDLVELRLFSNAVAALFIAPVVLAWAAGGRETLRAPLSRHAEGALVLAGLLAVSYAIFEGGAEATPALFYAPLPFLLWAAVRLGPTGTTSALLVMATLAIWGAVHGDGPFVGGLPEENARAVQLFLIAVAVPLLLLTAALAERERVELVAVSQGQQLTHLARVAQLGELSGALAHELNQPLTAILSNAQAAQRLLGSPRADQQELADILRDIVAADLRASEVIRRLRALFKKGESQFVRLDANELVREALDLAHSDLVTRGITVSTELAAGLPVLRGDRVQLQQVLLNLVMNACEAMTGARARSLLAASRRDTDGGVVISLVDSGPGFPDELVERVFEPFYSTKPNGLGLGLSISRTIVTAHGGRLWAVPDAARGAAFHIALPAG